MDIQELPKAELHCHLEACFRQKTLIELGQKMGIEVPSDSSEFRKNWLITEQMSDLATVLAKFNNVQSLWANEEAIERLTYEACEDAYQQNILIQEFRYSPNFIRMGHEDLSFEQIHQAIVRGVEKARKDFPMAIGLIAIVQRTLPLDEAERVTDFIIENKESFVAMDLADAEAGFDCMPFAPMFMKAKKAGLHITVHSGEENLPEAPQYVRNAIDHLGAERIGHGLQIFRDPETMTYLKEKKIPLELCPTSNWLTNAVKDTKEHPFRQLMEAGVLTTVNSDDPDIFGISLTSEYELLRDQHGFTEEEFNRCNDIAAQYSFISREEKQKVWPRNLLS